MIELTAPLPYLAEALVLSEVESIKPPLHIYLLPESEKGRLKW